MLLVPRSKRNTKLRVLRCRRDRYPTHPHFSRTLSFYIKQKGVLIKANDQTLIESKNRFDVLVTLEESAWDSVQPLRPKSPDIISWVTHASYANRQIPNTNSSACAVVFASSICTDHRDRPLCHQQVPLSQKPVTVISNRCRKLRKSKSAACAVVSAFRLHTFPLCTNHRVL